MNIRRIPQNLESFDKDRMYSVREIEEISQVPEGHIRNRIFRYKPEYAVVDGTIRFSGGVVREFLTHRKSGRRNKLSNN